MVWPGATYQALCRAVAFSAGEKSPRDQGPQHRSSGATGPTSQVTLDKSPDLLGPQFSVLSNGKDGVSNLKIMFQL